MVLVIHGHPRDCLSIQNVLSRHFKTRCICLENFQEEFVIEHFPLAIVYNFQKLDSGKVDLIEKMKTQYSGICHIVTTEDEKRIADSTDGMRIIPWNNSKMLITALKQIIFGETDWDEAVNEAENFILANFRDFRSKELLFDTLSVDPRKLRDEFMLRKGITMKRFLCEVRLKKVKELLQQSGKSEKYYGIALEAGLKNVSSLSALVKKMENMTIRELHEKLIVNDKLK